MSAGPPAQNNNTGSGGPHGGPGIGQIIGNVFIGTSSRDGDHRSLAWNWVPCGLVFAAFVVALVREPEGPLGQFLWVYAALIASFVVAFLRSVVGVDWSRASRATVSWASVILAVFCTLAMENLRGHGDVEAERWVHLIPSKNLRNGKEFVAELKGAPHRSLLRLTLDADEAEDAESWQRCRPGTRLVVPGADGGAGESALNTPHELAVGGYPARFSITLRTDEGCEMDVSVTEAVLHD